MINDYTKKIKTFTGDFILSSLNSQSPYQKYIKKHNVISFPSSLSHHEIKDPALQQVIVDDLLLDAAKISNQNTIFISIETMDEINNRVYTVYEVEHALLENVIRIYLTDLIRSLHEYDQFARQQLSNYFEYFFSVIDTDPVFTHKFISDLKHYNLSHDFRIGQSIDKKGLLRNHGGFMVDVNIHPSIEQKAFLKKVINLKIDDDIIYRGCFLFKSDFTVDLIDLRLYSKSDLYHDHFELSNHTGLHISCKEQSNFYSSKQKLDVFYQRFDLNDYKQTLYKLLKFHNKSNNRYQELFPELYVPSAYDFTNISFDEWDTRFLIQDMMDI